MTLGRGEAALVLLVALDGGFWTARSDWDRSASLERSGDWWMGGVRGMSSWEGMVGSALLLSASDCGDRQVLMRWELKGLDWGSASDRAASDDFESWLPGGAVQATWLSGSGAPPLPTLHDLRFWAISSGSWLSRGLGSGRAG